MDQERKLAVIKFGSESLVSEQGIDNGRLQSHAARIANLYDTHDVLVVTSGAVAWGRHRLEQADASESVSKRTLAMLGSAGIVTAWERAFFKTGLIAGQVLASHHEIRDDKVESSNFKRAYETARADKVIPILNHNDFLATPYSDDDELEKITKGKDNDEFSYEAARLLGADVLLLATSGVGGFEKVGVVQTSVKTNEIPFLRRHLYKSSKKGTGDMGSKLQVAARASQIGIQAFICSADANFSQVLSRQQTATEVIQ